MLDLRSKARQRLLAYYFTHPAARHHLRDLADRLSIDPSNLSREAAAFGARTTFPGGSEWPAEVFSAQPGVSLIP